MKGRVIVLNTEPRHAALVVDGQIEDLLFAPKEGSLPMPGEIRVAKVVRKIQGAAFLDLGEGVEGYLRDTRALDKQGVFPVQISSVPEPGKAVPVDRRLLIKGRNLILSPGAPGVNVSRQIRDPDERDRLQSSIPTGDEGDDGDGGGIGVIVRSAARDAPEDVLQSEFRVLRDRMVGDAGIIGQVFERFDPQTFALREWTSPLPDMIAVSVSAAREVTGHPMVEADPDLQDCIEAGDGDPFDHFGIWDEIEKLKSPRADLPSGGWMAVEETRAMVTVDVNTGDQFSGGAGMTANVEAARELPRQLRLRGLGGQVIIDFAPMKKAHRKKIEEVLKSAFRRDPIETSLAGWTPLGNFELQRKRERRPLTEMLRD